MGTQQKPNPPRPGDEKRPPITYAMLVGINEYDGEKISKLKNCIKDVELVEEFLADGQVLADRESFPDIKRDSSPDKELLTDKLGDLFILRLRNREATYENIIDGFQNFLRHARPMDKVWFHFSGHGSERATAEEFLEMEPNGKDQSLVCYNGPEIGDKNYYLADKELAVLLDEVATIDVNGGKKTSPPHIVVSLDCCHSGSGTRDSEIIPRIARNDDSINGLVATANGSMRRPLSSYVNEHYSKQKGALEVPVASHVLLSACESIELAGDGAVGEGGVFTSNLVKSLEMSDGDINYSDLFIRTRALIKGDFQPQTPQFETIGSFNPYTKFLDGTPKGKPDQYEISSITENNHTTWYIQCGAIQGLKIDEDKPIEVNIIDGNTGEEIAKTTIQSIGAQKSVIPGDMGLKTDGFYKGVLKHIPGAPTMVWLHGEEAAVQKMKDAWNSNKNIKIVEGSEKPADASIELEAHEGNYILKNASGKEILKQAQVVEHVDVEDFMMINIEKMTQWERVRRLANPRSQILQWIDSSMKTKMKDGSDPVFKKPSEDQNTNTDPAVDFVIDLETDDATFFNMNNVLGIGFTPQLIFKNVPKDQELHCYPLHLRPNYAIENVEGEFMFRQNEHVGENDVLLPLHKGQGLGWGLDPDDEESTCYFKILITTEEFNYQQFLQDGIGGTRGTFSFGPTTVKNDWCTQMIQVNIKRTT